MTKACVKDSVQFLILSIAGFLGDLGHLALFLHDSTS